MDGISCIFKRRSVRNYLQKPVEFDKIAVILKAGAKAPSAGNIQDYRFVLVTDKKVIQNIADHCTEQFWIAKAPVLIIVCSDTDRTESYYGLRGQRLYSVQNAAAAIQNMLLAAHDLSLGSCWVGSFDEDYVKSTLSIPEHIRPQAIVTIGYQDGEPDKREEAPLDTLVYFNSYGSSIENVHLLLREYNKEIEKIMKMPEPAVDNAIEKLKTHAKKLYHKTKENLKKNKEDSGK